MGQTLIKMIREDKGGAAAVAENSAEGMTETEQNRIKEELREIVLIFILIMPGKILKKH